MKMTSEIPNKEEFRKEFESGELYGKWKNIYEAEGYLADWARHRLKLVLRSIDRHTGVTGGLALDVGVGGGKLLKSLFQRNWRVYGVDFSYDMVRRVGGRVFDRNGDPLDTLLVGDVESLPVKSEKFDLVTCIGVLEYVASVAAALSEINRITRTGGCVVLAVGSYHRLDGLFDLVKNKFFHRKPSATRTESSTRNRVRLIKPLEFRAEAAKTGFTVEEFRCFGGRLWSRYFPLRITIPGLIYLGDHCLLVLRKPPNGSSATQR